MGIFDLFKKSENPDPDEQVLTQLKKAGSDLSKPHNIELFLYFPSKETANKAATTIKENGFDVEVYLAAEGDQWVCFTTKTIVPDLQAIQKISASFNKLADSLGGKYDGWGTEIVT